MTWLILEVTTMNSRSVTHSIDRDAPIRLSAICATADETVMRGQAISRQLTFSGLMVAGALCGLLWAALPSATGDVPLPGASKQAEVSQETARKL
jgi:hypothetical protein